MPAFDIVVESASTRKLDQGVLQDTFSIKVVVSPRVSWRLLLSKDQLDAWFASLKSIPAAAIALKAHPAVDKPHVQDALTGLLGFPPVRAAKSTWQLFKVEEHLAAAFDGEIAALQAKIGAMSALPAPVASPIVSVDQDESSLFARLGQVQSELTVAKNRVSTLERRVVDSERELQRRREALQSRQLSASVSRAEVRYSTKNVPFTAYAIEIVLGPHTFETFRRFKEFDTLDARLRTLFAEEPLPELPPKSSLLTHLTQRTQTPEMLDARRRGLGQYIAGLCQVPCVRDSIELHVFLRLPFHLERTMAASDVEWKRMQQQEKDGALADVDALKAELGALHERHERFQATVESERRARREEREQVEAALTLLVEGVGELLDGGDVEEAKKELAVRVAQIRTFFTLQR